MIISEDYSVESWKSRYDFSRISFREKFHFHAHVKEKWFCKIHVFKIRKVEKRYLSDWVNGSAHTCGPYFERSFPYHHHCCMVQMRSDGRWLWYYGYTLQKSKKERVFKCSSFVWLRNGICWEKWREGEMSRVNMR